MTQALHSLSYTGTLVYLHGNRLDTLRFSHAVRDGQELERLVALNGVAREVHRDPKAVTCVMPDAKAVSVEKRAPATQLWPSLDLARLERFYRLHPLGDYRVAGRATQVVGIIPRDKLRYGYRFYLDRETGLPLKTDLMNEKANPIEQIMFTSLGLHDEAPRPGDGKGVPDGYRTVLRDTLQTGREADSPQWEFDDLPVGFALRSHHHWSDAAGTQVEQLVLGDGLASVSVYVEQGGSEGLQGPAHIGAVNAWGGRVAGHQVTAVGEVPHGTVQQVAEALRRRPAGDDK
jgi:sigma-E factor negative regulatory protein RseB